MVISDGTFVSIIGHWLHHGYLSVSPVCLVTSPWCWCLLQIETPPATAGCPVLVVMVLPIWSRSLNLCLAELVVAVFRSMMEAMVIIPDSYIMDPVTMDDKSLVTMWPSNE